MKLSNWTRKFWRWRPGAAGSGRRRAVASGGAALLILTAVLGIGSLTASGADPVTTSGIVLEVGANESQRVVSWYTSANTAESVQVAPTSDLVGGNFPASATNYAATITANTVNGGFNGHAVIDGLQQNTAYSYRVGADGAWSATYGFKTQSFGTSPFDFLFFGDPQIGSSGDVAKDGAGWTDTLNVALAANPDAELLVSGGDQVETANTEPQWDAFLASDKLRSFPWAATIGNHDVGGRAYDQHFWTPNTDRSAPFYNGSASTRSGGDYWYTYKGVLFIHLNSNAFANGSDAAHVAFVTSIVNAHGADAKYTVLVYHHSIYSPADHANDSDNKQRRLDFPTAFSNLGVDLVLQGHDHSYSRSYAIKNGMKAYGYEQPGSAQVYEGPGGVIYVTGDSASGSKYYPLSAPIIGSDFGPDPLDPTGKRHWANSVENQENVRTYVKVSVGTSALVVQNIRSGTCAPPNAAFERGNVTWCGPNNGTSPAFPVGSLVDKLTIHPYGQCVTKQTGPLTVSADDAVCVSPGANVTGPVTVAPGGMLDIQGGRITGPITVNGAAFVRICGATITGPVTITGSTGLVVVGGDAATGPCAANTVTGPVNVTGNTAGAEVNGNRIVGSLTVTGNTGTVPPPDTGSAHAVGNSVVGPVTIQP